MEFKSGNISLKICPVQWVVIHSDRFAHSLFRWLRS
jgi:hypothetical protein